MKVWTLIQRHLRWKLFLSYAVIVMVGGAVLLVTARWRAPTVLTHQTMRMEPMMARMGNRAIVESNWRDSFMDSLNEIMLVAVVVAILAAFLMSLWMSRQIVEPVRHLRYASQRIAQGDYHERIQIVSRDELGDLAAAFNQMAQELEQTEQRRLELIGNVAHELRTPLGSLQAMMEGLIDGVLPGEPSTYVSIQSELDRLQRLVYDLQELSRVEARQLVLDQKPVHIGRVIEAAAARLRPQFDDKNVQLDLLLDHTMSPVTGDADRIVQVVVNLLGNALQYTPSGGAVQVSAEASAHEVAVTVSDTGIGIASEHLSRLFERFYRVDKSRSRAGGGSGIGLTIARHLVEAHGGTIRAASPGPDQGSAFTFTLPLASC